MAKAVDDAGAAHFLVPVDAGAAHAQVPVDAGGGAGQVQVGEGATVATGDEVQVPVDMVVNADYEEDTDRGEGAANAPVEAGVDVANDEEDGEVSPIPVDKKAGGLKMMMIKPERFANGGEGGIS